MGDITALLYPYFFHFSDDMMDGVAGHDWLILSVGEFYIFTRGLIFSCFLF